MVVFMIVFVEKLLLRSPRSLPVPSYSKLQELSLKGLPGD